jgi:FixJ family two-component response regulator
MTDSIKCLTGVFGFIEKPFETQTLLSMVKNAVVSKENPAGDR